MDRQISSRFLLLWALACVLASCPLCLARQVAGAPDAPDAREILRRYAESSAWAERVSMNVHVVKRFESHGKHTVHDFTYQRNGDRIAWDGHLAGYGGDGAVREDTCAHNRGLVNGKRFEGAVLEVQWPAGPCGRPFSVGMTPISGYKGDLFHYLPTSGFFLDGKLPGNCCKPVAELLAGGDLNLRGEREEIGGEACYVLEADTDHGMVTAWLAPDKGCIALKCVIDKRPGDMAGSTRLPVGEQFASLGWRTEARATRIERIGGVFVPVEGELQYSAFPGSGGHPDRQCTVTRDHVDLSPGFEALGAFELDVPDGTRVRRGDRMGECFVWREGEVVSVGGIRVVDKASRAIAATRRTTGRLLGSAGQAISRPTWTFFSGIVALFGGLAFASGVFVGTRFRNGVKS